MRNVRWVLWAGILAFVSCSPVVQQPAQDNPAPAAGQTQKTDTLFFAKPGKWIKKTKLPHPEGKTMFKGAEVLLLDRQSYLAPEYQDDYIETALYVKETSGLNMAGNLAVQWQPDHQSVTIHKAAILRNGKTIDILKRGQTFNVFQREQQLEASFIDGVKTAALQIEGLEVGDTVVFAYTIRTRTFIARIPSAQFLMKMDTVRANVAQVREVWPKSRKMRWQVSEDLPEPVVRTIGNDRELTVDLSNVKPVEVPYNAPVRNYMTGRIEVSDLPDWSPVSSAYAPYFSRVSHIKKGSQLYREAEKIAARTDDPRQRAAMALQLVQGRTRYLFVGLKSGGYIPMSAEETWAKRYGDCKAKTTLLLALLEHLGIEAEPALVNAKYGDGLDQRLPNLSLFDHVLVHAIIDKKEYWLDGTQSGDISLERIMLPAFHWALPLRKDGAGLIPVRQHVPSYMMKEVALRIDASKGLEGPVPMHATVVLRGWPARTLEQVVAGAERKDEKAYYRQFIRGYADLEIDNFHRNKDNVFGDVTVSLSGSLTLSREEGVNNYIEIPNFSYKSEFSALQTIGVEEGREENYILTYPYTDLVKTTILLPNGKDRFVYEGGNTEFDKDGVVLKRTIVIRNQALHMARFFSARKPEISANEAKNLQSFIKRIAKSTPLRFTDLRPVHKAKTKYLKASKGFGSLKNIEFYLKAGEEDLNTNNYTGAIKNFSAAINLDDRNSNAWAGRGMAYVQDGNYTEGKRDLERAMSLKKDSWAAYQGMGLLSQAQGDCAAAHRFYKRAIELRPTATYAKLQDIICLASMNEFAKALSEINEILEVQPDNSVLLGLKKDILDYKKADENLFGTASKSAVPDPEISMPEITFQLDTSASPASRKKRP